ncbi:MAG TPA: hypothetical protein VNW54_16395 [Granulicella sp.]|jgi:hypothetical protein|nr:hypothetical protein [Granulicella sp.]
MSPYPGEPKQPWQERLHEATAHVEEDLRRVVSYINDEVVPDVRRHGSEALRVAAQELHKLAERLEAQRRTPPPPPPVSPSGEAPPPTGEPKR